MSGRRRQALAPSLFPFLAVLVCTLGTLILLLALVAQNATSAAERSAQAQQQAADQESRQAAPPRLRRLVATAVESMIQEEQFRVQQLVSVRDQQTADVEQKRDQLTHMEDHITRLQDQLKQLNDEVERATGNTPTNIVDVSAIEKLESEIEEQQAVLADLRAEAEDRTPRIVIVPHQGPNGTSRRPIYLECTQHGVTIWPEGSQISTLQLADAIASANPLDSALRAIRYHSMQNYGDSTPPYPLLVVRPDGIDSYAAARRAMQDWDDQFGYELVPAEVKLAFPKADAQLKQRIDLAIREAAVRQHARHRMASESVRRYRDRLPTLSAASLDRQGRAGGFKSHRDTRSPAGRGSSPYASGPAYSAGSSSYSGAGSTATPGAQSETVRRLDEHLRTASEELNQQRSASGHSLGGPAEVGLANPYTLPTDTTASHGLTLPASQSLGSSGGAAGSHRGTTGTSPLSSQTSGGAFGKPQGSGLRHNSYTLPQEVPNTLADSRMPLSDGPPGLHGAPSGETDSIAADTSQQGPGDDPGPDSNSNPASESDLESEAGPKSNRDSAADSRSPGNSRAGGDAARGTSQASADASAMRPSSGESAQAARMGAMNQVPGLNQKQSGAVPSQASSSPMGGQSLVKRQGADWALPQSMMGAHGNEIVRTIRVQCFPDRFVLVPPSSGGATEMFGFSDGQVNRATLQLATAVRDRVQRWGAAIPGGRWQPRLDVEVMPRGEARFHQLRTLMNGSGVEVQGRSAR
jgi:hypothetical protein